MSRNAARSLKEKGKNASKQPKTVKARGDWTCEVEEAEGVVAEDLLKVIFHEITFDKITIVILMIHPTGITITVQ